MIYLIQPIDNQVPSQAILEELLVSKHLSYEIVSALPPLEQVFNTYFIINDTSQTNWSCLDDAQAIRRQDKVGHLILLTNQVNYTKLFRSHLSFLEVIVFEEMVTAVTAYIDEFYITNNDGKC